MANHVLILPSRIISIHTICTSILIITFIALSTVSAHAAQIRGTVKSTVGAPLVAAVVTIAREQGDKPHSSVDLKSDGTFSLTTTMVGMYSLVIAGANHQSQTYSGFISARDEVIDMEAVLATNLQGGLDSVKIVCDATKWDFERALPLVKGQDGIWSATVPNNAKQFRYQVLMYHTGSIKGMVHSTNGTQQDSLEYDNGGDFISIIHSGAKQVTVQFDPARLPTSTAKGYIRVHGQDHITADSLVLHAQSRFSVNNGNAFEIIAKTKAMLATTPSPALKQLITLRLMTMYSFLSSPTKSDSIQVKKLFASVPFTSPAWSVYVKDLGHTMYHFGMLDQYHPTLKKIYAQEAEPARSNIIANQIYYTGTYGEYFNIPALPEYAFITLTKSYPRAERTEAARKSWDPNRNIKPGNPLPQFSYASLDEPDVKNTPERFKGKWVLVDLWATWCGPCVGELPNLTEAYKQFHDKGLEILSISLDTDMKNIGPFRQKRFAMPWKHSFTFGVFNSEAARLFEVTAIPKIMLVNPEGTIVAINTGLRGEELLGTLAKMMR